MPPEENNVCYGWNEVFSQFWQTGGFSEWTGDKYLRQAVYRWRIGDCFILTIKSNKKLEMPGDKEK